MNKSTVKVMRCPKCGRRTMFQLVDPEKGIYKCTACKAYKTK